jgi:hypothetical protein
VPDVDAAWTWLVERHHACDPTERGV